MSEGHPAPPSSVALVEKSGAFPATHWSVVLAARTENHSEGMLALETLCRTYRYPLYAFIRRQGYSPEDAEDLTQGFFEHLLEHQTLDRVAPEKGRFRSFLLASLKYYVSDQRAHEQRQKRGGGRSAVSLDAVTAEQRYHLEPRDDRSPEQLFELRYAMELLDQTLAQLRCEFGDGKQAALFEALQPFLAAKEGGDTYAVLAARFGRSEEAIKKTVQRMRRRYQELIREEIAHTVSDFAEIEEELRHLSAVIGG